MQRLLQGGCKDVTFDGNINNITRTEDGKLLFRIELANVTGLNDFKAEVQISPTNWSARGRKADVIEKTFANGDLVRARGYVAVSEMNGNVKFKTRSIEPLRLLVKDDTR